MGKIACAACGKPMHDSSIACPHCGARRADVKAGMANKNMSKDEVRALLTVEAPPSPNTTSRGVFAPLVLPHDHSHGAARVAELALTVVALPLVLAGAITYTFTRGTRRSQMDAVSGEWTPAILMALLGGVMLWSLAGTAVTLVSLGALLGRTVLRTRTGDARSDELSRLK